MSERLVTTTTTKKSQGTGRMQKPIFTRFTSLLNRILAGPRFLKKKWRRWRAGIFLKRLRKMLLHLNSKLQNAGYPRNERRAILHNILKDMKCASEILGDK